jgi:mono/diheme cytochrome c family protein
MQLRANTGRTSRVISPRFVWARFARGRFAAALGLALLAASVARATAQDAVAGCRLAETWCVNCHVVGPGSQSGTSTGAPTFPAIAQMGSVSPMSLRVFLQTPHNRMPDLHLSRQEIDDVSTYILGLREKK